MTAMQSVRTVVIGTGAMAPGIAAEYARLGPTQIAGRDDDKIDAALDVACGALATLADAGLLDPAEAARRAPSSLARRLTLPTSQARLSSSSPSSRIWPTKQTLFAMLDAWTAPTALLCSNTSSLSITAIASGLTHPGARDRHALLEPAAPSAAR